MIVSLFDTLLDGTIYYSFDGSGYRRHQKSFRAEDLDVSLAGRVCLVTGANSGLGYEAVRGLAERGARVYMLCRNLERGARARAAIQGEYPDADVRLEQVDLSSPDSLRAFAGRFGGKRVDVLVHNAGLLPSERTLTDEGFELTVAVHVLGPHLLTRLLQQNLQGGRLIWVSSGGMYSKRLSMETMLRTEGRYDGVAAYAMTKRAQVILSEMWADELAQREVSVHAMHPGWAATPGVESSLPGFWKRMEDRLRTSAEGADTILWLAVCPARAEDSGLFWFDRRAVRTHLGWWTRERASEREALWRFCEENAAA